MKSVDNIPMTLDELEAWDERYAIVIEQGDVSALAAESIADATVRRMRAPE